MVDAADSKSAGREAVGVRVPLWAHWLDSVERDARDKKGRVNEEGARPFRTIVGITRMFKRVRCIAVVTKYGGKQVVW